MRLRINDSPTGVDSLSGEKERSSGTCERTGLRCGEPAVFFFLLCCRPTVSFLWIFANWITGILFCSRSDFAVGLLCAPGAVALYDFWVGGIRNYGCSLYVLGLS